MDKYIKDPDAVLDYAIDWSAWLDTDTITASSWAANSENISIESSAHDDTQAVVWLSGGTVGEAYVLTNHITTAAGRQEDQSFKIKMKEK
jgi:hypothetical protein